MFVLSSFQIGQQMIKLVFPEEKQAEELFEIIETDRKALSEWMPWTKNVKSKKDEIEFINYAREKNAKYQLLELAIIAGNQPIGMIDLHSIDRDDRRAEVGYWMFSKYQGKGIMTESLKRLLSIAFDELDLNKIIVMADSKNEKSRAIPQRLGFRQEGTLKEEIFMNKQFRDLDVFAITTSEYKIKNS
ncbi:GNAT family N-acetyltransferase [Oenococcus oeni]|uniref:Ribosomal protein N-acetyltransferase n=2 Tax=Oenococcus oeni TaxID=1247 RepID=A0AAQ2ZDL3_OENOE|nr:GNAT family protein [Oenococcus oeni]EJN99320.1 acetyltransferase [Oenococcus oeni AWRIB418]KGH61731.1 acetyltransferase [Oenococcus oeni S13]KGH77875.1 acetyltransferase [Oenococcus oeni IOEB_9304]KGH84942.1 acetyltransferase [Oenococcus oeni IOEB_C28]KGI01803.1 acetyltransferase [Oenococcus oeni IOEB_C52]